MPLSRRLPKRGFHNRFRVEYEILNVGDLNGVGDGEAVDPAKAAELGLIRGSSRPLKVLGGGDLERRLVVSAHRFSKSAREKIQKAGGDVKELPC